MDLAYFVEPVSWQFDEAPIRAVRSEVFIDEQQVPEEEEWDDLDPVAQHFLATARDGSPIGTARLTREGTVGHIGRMAVLRSWRGRGVGASLMRAALEYSGALGLQEVRLMAQTHAIQFYERYGFEAFGNTFDDVGIAHRWMKSNLTPLPGPPEVVPRREVPADDRKYREEIDDRVALTRHFNTLIDGTRHELAVWTRTLEPRILDTPVVMTALRRLCTAGAPARVRVLVQDSRPAVAASHPLIALSHRLPSVIAFRRPGKDHQDHPSAFAVADENHVIFRPFGDQYGGYYQHQHRREARRLLEFFDDAWEQGDDDPNFRRLAL